MILLRGWLKVSLDQQCDKNTENLMDVLIIFLSVTCQSQSHSGLILQMAAFVVHKYSIKKNTLAFIYCRSGLLKVAAKTGSTK